MEFKSHLCYIMLLYLLNNVLTERVFLKSKEHGFVGLSNRWTSNITNGGGAPWDYKENKNQYVVCLNKNSLLQTDLFPLPSSLNIVYANATIQGRLCEKLKHDPDICEDKISVGAFIGDYEPQTTITNRDFVTFPEMKPTVDFYNISKITKYKNLQRKKFIQYVFNSNMFCGSLVNFTVFYYKCPAVKSLVAFASNIFAPSDGMKRVEGNCVVNSINKNGSTPYIDCTWDGQGTVVSSCTCVEGYTNTSTDCQKCGPTEFKSSVGNIPCSKCGKNSNSNNDRKECVCIDGFFREIGKENENEEKCFKLPEKPTINNRTATSTEIYLKWSKDEDPNANYIIRCRNCPPNQNFPFRTNQLYITIRKLGSFARYDLQLTVENENTKKTGKENPLQIFVTTKKGVPGAVQNVTHTINSDGSVTLKWKPPFAKGSDVLKYLIRYGGLSSETTKTKYTIKRDRHSKSYTVTITVHAIVNGENLTGPIFTYSVKISVKGRITTIIGGVLGGFILLVMILFVAFCVKSRREVSQFPTQTVLMENGTVKPSNRFYDGSKLYADPSTFKSIDDAVSNFAFVLDQKQLKIGNLLGEGEFGYVYKGTLIKNGKLKEVAIKTMKTSTTEKNRDDFLYEAAIIGQFNDPNVISLEGIILKEQSIIVLELMVNGALDKFLQGSNDQFTILQLLKMACDVASGMKYLSGLGFLHRDLAARNILVDENITCKVSDFGMSREIKADDVYKSKGGKIPLRWTAPEAIEFKTYTAASDVWSYGIVLWEIMSYGKTPYCFLSNYEILGHLSQGYRLPQPVNCPKEIHDLMLTCWNKDSTKRPRMEEIWHQLKLWITDLEASDCKVSLESTVSQTINEWLDSIEMGRYTNKFLEKGFSTPRQIFDLTLNDLKWLGIAPTGHRKKIFEAIQNTKVQYINPHVKYIHMGSPYIHMSSSCTDMKASYVVIIDSEKKC